MSKLEIDDEFSVNQLLIADFDAYVWGKSLIWILFVQYSFIYLKFGVFFKSVLYDYPLVYQIQLTAKSNFLCIGCCDLYIFYNGLSHGINGQASFCWIRWYISRVFHTILSLYVFLLSCMECGYKLSFSLLIIVLYIELNLSNLKVQKNNNW